MATAAVGLVALAPQQQPGDVQASSPQGVATTPDALRCKRRISFGYAAPPHHHHQPASVARRNARERNRVKQVNNGFATLRQHIPVSVAATLSPPPAAAASPASRAASKKLSKVETLRMAVEYIRGLQRLLEEHSAQQPGATSPPEHGYCCRQSPPPCSDAASSPAPSFTSEGSGSGSGSGSAVYVADNCENYEPMSPEDEELLDVISWWQQSQ